MEIETVLCPIDFSSLSDYELALATEVCETFGARLVLHHNLAAAGPGFAKAWEWEAAHHRPLDVSAKGERDETEEGRARRLMAEILERLPDSVQAEARISRGPVGLVLLYLIEEIDADLVILGSHGWTSEEHVSLCERLIESAPCPVLTFQEGRGEHAFRLRPGKGEPPGILVPTDFSESAAAALAFACDLARRASLRLHLLHVESARPAAVPVDPSQGVGMGAAANGSAERRLRELLPGDLAERASCRVASGSVAAEILKVAVGLDAELIVMGEHARGFFRRYFTRDTAREMLHRARCPVWYVPPMAARAG
jgi:nucleotide-binding universal stress UspA family protein